MRLFTAQGDELVISVYSTETWLGWWRHSRNCSRVAIRTVVTMQMQLARTESDSEANLVMIGADREGSKNLVCVAVGDWSHAAGGWGQVPDLQVRPSRRRERSINSLSATRGQRHSHSMAPESVGALRLRTGAGNVPAIDEPYNRRVCDNARFASESLRLLDALDWWGDGPEPLSTTGQVGAAAQSQPGGFDSEADKRPPHMPSATIGSTEPRAMLG